MAYNKDISKKVSIILPKPLYERILDNAIKNRRSINSEIVFSLEKVFINDTRKDM